jgi:hypothetical protein
MISLTRSDPTIVDPLEVNPSAYASDPIGKQQTGSILSELRAEKESFSREVLGQRSFEDGGE